MNANIDTQNNDSNDNNNTAALFVSLYVVLLAFFILLTSNSQFDAEKTKNVTDSVKKAFSMDVPTDTNIKTPTHGSEVSVKQFFNELQTAVHSIVPIEEMDVITDGRTMVMKMQSTALFNRDDPNLRYDRRDFYRRLSDIMTKWREGMRMQLEFLQGVDKSAQASTASTLEITRAGNFARFMENRGTIPQSLSVALEQNAPDTITMIFTVVSLDTTKLNFMKEKAPDTAPAQGAIPLSNMKAKP
ncbi:MAG: hypothetical protein MK052_05195 [Alphaproteobacteria bacterium]|nr:hypothetical protein [Alphaproteobacteria bacterium]